MQQLAGKPSFDRVLDAVRLQTQPLIPQPILTQIAQSLVAKSNRLNQRSNASMVTLAQQLITQRNKLLERRLLDGKFLARHLLRKLQEFILTDLELAYIHILILRLL